MDGPWLRRLELEPLTSYTSQTSLGATRLRRTENSNATGDVWALQDAKARLSELVERAATTRRPQRITRRGQEVVVVLESREYRRLANTRNRPLVSFLREVAPLPDDIVDRINQRDSNAGRDPGIE